MHIPEMKREFVLSLTSTGQDGFGADPAWLSKKANEGVVCSYCGRVQPGLTNRLGPVVIVNQRPLVPHFGPVGRMMLASAISDSLLNAFGRERLETIVRILPIADRNGDIDKTHVCLISETTGNGFIRGPMPNEPTLCGVCGGLMYWPGWPPTSWYLLAHYWPRRCEVDYMDGHLIVSQQFYKRAIAPLKLPRLKGDKIRLVQHPSDGLPVDVDKVCEDLRSQSAFQMPRDA